jgi:hypothetical protein
VDGCGRTFARSHLSHHQRHDCVKGVTKCPLAVHGCGVRVAREKLDEHEIEAGRQHTRLLSARLTELTERFARLASLVMAPPPASGLVSPSTSSSWASQVAGSTPLGSPHNSTVASTTPATAPATGAAATETKQYPIINGPFRFYILGGVTNDRRDTATCVAYETKENKWLVLPSKPSPTSYAVSAPFGRTIYTFGGYSSANGSRLNVARAYNTTARGGTWRALPSMPNVRAGHQVTLVRSFVFMSID